MNNVLEITKQALGLAPIEPTRLDVKLLTDGIGRTLPMSGSAAYTGAAPVNWLGTGWDDQTQYGYSNHGTAFSIVSYILSTASSLPWNAYRIDSKDNRAEIAVGSALANLCYRPNPRQSWSAFKTQCEGGHLVNGQFFIRRVRPAVGSRRGKTAELWCLVGAVEPLRLADNGSPLPLGEFDTPTHYRHTDAVTGAVTLYPYDDILHVYTYNPNNPHKGLSPVAAGIDAITAAKSGLESRALQYQNQGPKGIVFSKPAPNATEPDVWTAEQAGRVQQWFGGFFGQRRKNSGQIPIISRELGYLSMGLSPVDLDVLAAIPHDKDAIADLWHFPGQLLNGSKGTTFSNMGEAGAALYSRCVIPLETVLRDELNRWLGPEYEDGVYLDFDVSHVPELQAAKQKQAETLAAAWWIPVKMKQQLMGIPVTWDGPEYVVPSMLVDYADLTAVAEGADVAPKPGDIVT